jgi:hypothetical protein
MSIEKQRFVQVTWCDDIRREVGEKLSLMGTYQGEIGLPTIPAVLPRLGALVTVTTPLHRPFRKMRVRIMREDAVEPVALVEVAEHDLKAAAADISGTAETRDDVSFAGFTMAFLMGPLQITEQTRSLKVWVDTEDETLESFRLRFEQQAHAVGAAAADVAR